MTNAVSGALNTAILSLAKQAARVERNAGQLGTALISAQNQAAAASAGPSNQTPTDATLSSETLNTSADIFTPLLDLLQAKTAYTTSVKAAKITADVEQSTVDRLGHRSTKV